MKNKSILWKVAKTLLKIIAVAAFWIAVWWLAAKRVGVDFLLPSPLSVGKELLRLLPDASFWLITATSLLRMIWGILISLILGTLLAYLLSVSRLLRALLSPVISAIKATPVASFIILALLWLNRDILPVFITVLIVVPIVCANVLEGISSVDRELCEVATVYRFSLPKKLLRLYVPSVAPFFLAACRSSIGMAWKAGMAAEILATPQNAIGTELYFAKTYFETPTLFAWSLVVILLSLIIEKLFLLGLEQIGKRFRWIVKGGRDDQA